MASTLVPPQISYLVLIPFSLVTVKQSRTTTAAKTAIRKGQPCRCRLGPRHPTYRLESAVNGAKCDGELTVMEQPEAPSSARPIELYRHPEHQVLGCRQTIAFTLVSRCFSRTDQSQAFGRNILIRPTG